MKIGIIGAGHIGSALARHFVRLGHQVFIANSRGPDTLGAVAAETGATAATAQDAVRGAEFVVLTIPLKNVPNLPKGLLSELPASVPVVDTCNYYPRQRDGRIAAIEDGTVESHWVEGQIGHSVIKAFNNIYAAHLADLGRPAGTEKRIALPVAGDDAAAKQAVMALVDAIGFDPVDAGSIADSWRQQPGTPVYTMDFDKAGVADALAKASRERTADWRA